MKILCIVPCGKRKIWDKTKNAGPAQSRDVYIGPFAKKCREYAERFFPDAYLILSAKYGFLYPSDIVPGPYNVSFNDRKTKPISVEELIAQAKEKGLSGFDKVVVIGGVNYVDMAKRAFPESSIITPLKGCKGMGYMLSRLSDAIKTGKSGADND